MSWQRKHFKKVQKPFRKPRVPLRVLYCVDCQSPLHVTHMVAHFGERCRGCWQLFAVVFEGESMRDAS